MSEKFFELFILYIYIYIYTHIFRNMQWTLQDEDHHPGVKESRHSIRRDLYTKSMTFSRDRRHNLIRRQNCLTYFSILKQFFATVD